MNTNHHLAVLLESKTSREVANCALLFMEAPPHHITDFFFLGIHHVRFIIVANYCKSGEGG